MYSRVEAATAEAPGALPNPEVQDGGPQWIQVPRLHVGYVYVSFQFTDTFVVALTRLRPSRCIGSNADGMAFRPFSTVDCVFVNRLGWGFLLSAVVFFFL